MLSLAQNKSSKQKKWECLSSLFDQFFRIQKTQMTGLLSNPNEVMERRRGKQFSKECLTSGYALPRSMYLDHDLLYLQIGCVHLFPLNQVSTHNIHKDLDSRVDDRIERFN